MDFPSLNIYQCPGISGVLCRGNIDGVEEHRGDGAHHEAGDEQEFLDGDHERRAGLVFLAAVGKSAVFDLVAVQLVDLPEAELLHVVLQGRMIQWNFGNYTNSRIGRAFQSGFWKLDSLKKICPSSIESFLASLDGFAVVSFVTRASALFELVAALLPLQDANRVEAALRAAAPPKHGAAEAVVVLEGGGAL